MEWFISLYLYKSLVYSWKCKFFQLAPFFFMTVSFFVFFFVYQCHILYFCVYQCHFMYFLYISVFFCISVSFFLFFSQLYGCRWIPNFWEIKSVNQSVSLVVPVSQSASQSVINTSFAFTYPPFHS